MNNLLNLLQQSKIIIPPIQRDYAQGRNTGKIPTIRERFLENIVEVLTDESLPPMELDFISIKNLAQAWLTPPALCSLPEIGPIWHPKPGKAKPIPGRPPFRTAVGL